MANFLIYDGASTYNPFDYEYPINKINNNPKTFKFPPKHSVCLPQKDHFIVERQLALETKQYTYNFEHNVRVAGFDTPVVGLPPCFKYMAPTYELPKCEQLMNPSFAAHGFSLLFSDFQAKINNYLTNKKSEYFGSVSEYLKMIMLPNPPKLIENQTIESLNKFEWLNDKEFGRQRLQGLNAGQLIRLTNEKVQELDLFNKLKFEKMLPTFNMILSSEVNSNFQKMLDNGNLYMVDYSIFDDVNYYESAKKRGRYISSPIALFYINENDEKLYPLCIKILQNDELSPVFTPASNPPESWIFAKLWFQSADGQHMEFFTHLYECHLLGEVFTIATHRQLSTSHPIYQLLHPHFDLLLDINHRARGNLLSSFGPIESLLGGGSIAALHLIVKYHKNFIWRDNTFLNRLKKNNTLNDNKNRKYYFKEDGIEIYKNLFGFVQDVLSKFYTSKEDIERDFELHSWVDEITSEHGGTIKGLIEGEKLVELTQVVELVTDIIFRVTVEHSIGNHGQWDMFGFTPNVPGALYMDPHKIIEGIPTTFEMIINSLPPKKETQDQIAITHLLANTDTGLPTFISTIYEFEKDQSAPNFKDICSSYRSKMEHLSTIIENRNKNVNMPYSYMDPSKICGSIYI
ncbi:hypothetical protein DDB_G0279909 [Dictyostelium discoideum AX4]|uniref:Lipoxygenase domain-containing protein n=2 Tax=Dictyostelium discoideum TaxID=44689 RepID=Q54W35_DICDI|nr:hypothetical protein DDB_G0279909 [Dictyostelium discoideum AX4]EAL67426.1 hypothetical protein DDB_G0279909 [Dictyostelium discoideum AX4]|eukprot:XP_641415.1 hypothetical protein DDB_G0279909 [Dictyostelium discoideum AX4]